MNAGTYQLTTVITAASQPVKNSLSGNSVQRLHTEHGSYLTVVNSHAGLDAQNVRVHDVVKLTIVKSTTRVAIIDNQTEAQRIERAFVASAVPPRTGRYVLQDDGSARWVEQ